MGVLGLEAFFIYGVVGNFYGYIIKQIYYDIYLAAFSVILTGVLTVFLVLLLANYLEKKKFLKSFQ